MMAHILIVDDERDMLTVTKLMLEMEGHTVTTAADGLEGLHKALEHRPDLVVTDLMMPIMNGMELCERLRHANGLPQVPIVLNSAAAEPATEHRQLFDEFVRKPVAFEVLARIIGRLLKGAG